MGRKKKSVSSVDLKEQGNRAYSNREFEKALDFYNKGIEVDPKNAVLFSNRSAALIALHRYEEALTATDIALSLQANYFRALVRKATAFHELSRFDEAIEVIDAAISLEPENSEVVSLKERILQDQATELALPLDHPERSRFVRLITWLKDGGAIFPKLTLRLYSADYRGVHASTHVFKNETILFVPKSHIMTLEMAKATPIGRKMEEANLNLISPKHCFLSTLVLQERRVPDSFWEPYLDILPKSFTSFPIFFTPEEKAWLTGSPFLKQIEDKIEDIKDDYETILRIAPEYEQFSIKEFSEIRVTVSSRIFGMEIDGQKTDGFVPLADMLNHKRPRQTSWSYDQMKGGFIIEANEEIERGLEVMDSYGKKCNSRFLLNYGFIVLENDGNEYPFKIALTPNDQHYRLKKNILESNSEQVLRVMASIKEEVFLEVLGMLRFIELEEDHLLPQLVQECSAENSRFKLSRVPPISIKNELRVLQRLKNLAQEGLEAYPETLAHDEALLETTDLTQNQRNCVLMRKGEKEILHWFIKFVDTVTPLLNLQPKELRKTTRPAEIEEYVANCVTALVKNEGLAH
mmetsp:Transcript_5762/g.10286  ORF Transcript_5762/g.10286 Transcript_5762/m.10286 type:complete len:577 (-) Transcript_5762:40-1770(-)|eukprot:CAMPEP_0204903772 /NCGR_PEP_ID=MMETSP1397-20131031/4469_1 /ASSEMBLY_ACC=CAM_ASM_000891 /TAXON_ID=49980 /ORGANISM="Climacostomum Climacostomum virens, Strain Stock W-24" /LENGTH=576 /DNA_ID=CAMNT_0052072473 /DNA_START=430 /DNA_END=2160 /DNA_ORIENTATION=+